MEKNSNLNSEDMQFLQMIYGDNIPEEIEIDSSNALVKVYTLGKPNVEIFVKTALTLMS